MPTSGFFPCQLRVQSSRLPWVFGLALVLCTLPLLWSLPLLHGVAALLLALGPLGWGWRELSQLAAGGACLYWDGDGALLRLEYPAGAGREMLTLVAPLQILPSSRLLPWFLALQLRDTTGQDHALWLWRDAMTVSEWRRLQVWWQLVVPGLLQGSASDNATENA